MPFDKKLVLVAGLDPNERHSIAAAMSADGTPLCLMPLRECDRERLIGAVVEESLADEVRIEEDLPLKPAHPLVFFALFPRSGIDAFIEAVKTAVPRRAMYAALTPTNMNWTVTTLVEHLLEEHEHFLRLEASSASLGQEAPQ